MGKEIHLPAEAFQEGKTVTIIEGKALDQRPKLVHTLSGNILAPGEFLTKRLALNMIVPTACVVVADAPNGMITLFENVDGDEQRNTIVGRLKKDHFLSELNINDLNVTYEAKELGKFLKKFRNYFENRTQYENLMKALFAFSAKVQTVIENESDTKGNSKNLLQKTVESSVPSTFNLKLPVFSGFPPEVFEVEICAEATSDKVKFWMESIDLLSLEQRLAEQILEEQTKKFEDFGCPVIWQ